MKKKSLLLVCFSFFFFVQVPKTLAAETPALLDLSDMAQDYVLETKQIVIPHYPYSFNPSIVRWHGSLLLTFRIRNPLNGSTNKIGLAWLDENFDVIGHAFELNMRLKKPFKYSQQQDPRFIFLKDKLFMVFNNVWEKKPQYGKADGNEIRRMLVGELQYDGDQFFMEDPQWLCHFEKEDENRSEKNWVPFDYNGTLLLSYSIAPYHRVLRSAACDDECETFALTHTQMNWKWGSLRGGSQASLEGGEYLSFFHTCKDMATVQSNGEKMVHYFMGAYTFSKDYPFAVTRMSPEPIIGEDFYTGPPYKTWKPLRVVFPGGYVSNNKYIWVVYGKQDHEMWVVKLDKAKLLKSLVKVPPS